MKMRRLALISAVTLFLSSHVSLPVIAQLGEVQVTLTCSDGIEITATTLVVDTATLPALEAAVDAMTLYPAGLVCSLTQTSASLPGGLIGPAVAFAQGNPKKDYAVGGGRSLSFGQ